MFGITGDAGRRGGDDDATAAARSQRRRDGPDAERDRPHVHGERPVEVLHRQIEQAPAHRHPRIEDRRIEPTEPLGGSGDGGIVGVDRGHVADNGVDARRMLGLGGPGQGIGETIDGDDERAVRDHPLDGGTPDPRCRTGDDGDPAAHGFM